MFGAPAKISQACDPRKALERQFRLRAVGGFPSPTDRNRCEAFIREPVDRKPASDPTADMHRRGSESRSADTFLTGRCSRPNNVSGPPNAIVEVYKAAYRAGMSSKVVAALTADGAHKHRANREFGIAFMRGVRQNIEAKSTTGRPA
jgi:hypothetical protein